MKVTMKLLAAAVTLVLGAQAHALSGAPVRAVEAITALRATNSAEVVSILKSANVSSKTIAAVSAGGALSKQAENEIIAKLNKFPAVAEALASSLDGTSATVALENATAALASAKPQSASSLNNNVAIDSLVNPTALRTKFVAIAQKRVDRLRAIDANKAADAQRMLDRIATSKSTFTTLGPDMLGCAQDYTQEAFLAALEMHAEAQEAGTYKQAADQMIAALKRLGLNTADLTAEMRLCILGGQPPQAYAGTECSLVSEATASTVCK